MAECLDTGLYGMIYAIRPLLNATGAFPINYNRNTLGAVVSDAQGALPKMKTYGLASCPVNPMLNPFYRLSARLSFIVT